MAPETARPGDGCLVRVPPSAPGFISRALATSALAVALSASSAHALRVVNYNILNYPGTSATVRNPHFRTVIGPLAADVLVVQEMQSQAGVDGFRTNVLNTLEPGQWAAAPFVNGNDTDNALFYRSSAVQLLGAWSFYPPGTSLRLVSCYRLKPVGYTSAAAEFRIYSLHLKASQGSDNEAQRLAEATGLRDSLNAVPPGTHVIVTGDFNIYSGSEPAFTKFLENQADNDGRLYDPLNAPLSTWNTPSLAAIHTQSPCLSGGAACASGAATGGLDDRFDMFLPTYNFKDNTGLELLTATYKPVGNDAQHFDKNITDAPTIPEGATYASALILAADHLPVRVDLQLPAILDAPPSLALGTVIVGGGADLSIGNDASVPGDGLTYTLTPSAGFAAPAGGDVPASQVAAIPVTTTPGTPGPRMGTLTITSDAPDLPLQVLSLTATVLDHAAASLDSSLLRASDSLAFDGVAGTLADRAVRVYNQGWDANQARLAVQGQTLTGSPLFSLLDAGPALLSNLGRSYTVRFDESSAVPDVVYTGTLKITSADEPLPGATARPDLTVTLRGILRSTPVSTATVLPMHGVALRSRAPRSRAFGRARPGGTAGRDSRRSRLRSRASLRTVAAAPRRWLGARSRRLLPAHDGQRRNAFRRTVRGGTVSP
jgi:endonuclease/exonuclease/phosphatase family metal-dependent hydrolase